LLADAHGMMEAKVRGDNMSGSKTAGLATLISKLL